MIKMSTEKEFEPSIDTSNLNLEAGQATWQSPSNIALVKYWGKYGVQMPANTSVSFTLSNCNTQTKLAWTPGNGHRKFFFEGKEANEFGAKAFNFLDKYQVYFPWIKELDLTIETENTFPHSSGIASSASGMSALALGVMSIEKQINPNISEEEFKQKASFLARLGSGSACRSVYGGVVSWGENELIKDSSNLYGTPVNEIHPVFQDFKDTVLLVDKGEKKVSSTAGHGLMNGHKYAHARFEQANLQVVEMIDYLKAGDVSAMGELMESEALTLHAMMMTSRPYYLLMRPNTLSIIEEIWAARQDGLPVYFTLDAGANVHMLYPKEAEQKVLDFVNNKLVAYCQQGHYICDEVGKGPKLI